MSAYSWGIEMNIAEETLKRMSRLTRHTAQYFSFIEPYLGNCILDVGCGIGTFTEFLARKSPTIGIDISQRCVAEAKSKLKNIKTVEVFQYDIESEAVLELRHLNVDTIVCFDVLEHVDERRALKNMHDILNENGKLILKVPACRFLYNVLDVNLGHKCRYNKNQLNRLLQNHGFKIEQQYFINILGMLGWFFYGKILRRQIVPVKELKVCDILAPRLMEFERKIKLPVGLALLTVCTKSNSE